MKANQDESEAVTRAAAKKGVNPDYLLAILRVHHKDAEKGKKLQISQAIESIIDEEVGRRHLK